MLFVFFVRRHALNWSHHHLNYPCGFLILSRVRIGIWFCFERDAISSTFDAIWRQTNLCALNEHSSTTIILPICAVSIPFLDSGCVPNVITRDSIVCHGGDLFQLQDRLQTASIQQLSSQMRTHSLSLYLIHVAVQWHGHHLTIASTISFPAIVIIESLCDLVADADCFDHIIRILDAAHPLHRVLGDPVADFGEVLVDWILTMVRREEIDIDIFDAEIGIIYQFDEREIQELIRVKVLPVIAPERDGRDGRVDDQIPNDVHRQDMAQK